MKGICNESQGGSSEADRNLCDKECKRQADDDDELLRRSEV